jgi:hypothetical protein
MPRLRDTYGIAVWWARQLVVLWLAFGVAHADDRPWAAGVSAEQQALALTIYDAGNAEFVESRFTQAAARYREALTHWDHPAIHFNLAVALINLDEPIDAREHLEKSLAFGPAGIGGDGVHAQALTYTKLLDGQLARLALRCDEPGAEVSLDGLRVFVGPGQAERFLRPGPHQIVATKRGYVSSTETVELSAGTQLQHRVELVVEAPRTMRMVRRWDAGKLWVLTGSGVLIAGIGGVALASGRRDIERFDAGVELQCPRGCSVDRVAELGSLFSMRERAETKQVLAILLFALGGAALGTGIVAMIVNEPRAQLEATPGGMTVGLAGRF